MQIIGLVANQLVIWERSSNKAPRIITLSLSVNVPLAPDFCSILPDNILLLVYTGQSTAADPVFTLWSLRECGNGKVTLILNGCMPEAYGRVVSRSDDYI